MSKKVKQIILMADIIDSRSKDSNKIMKTFKMIVNEVNISFKKEILSPLTITIGDEFQSVIVDIEKAIKIILHIEEELINQKANFKLRYVLYQGIIDTRVNPIIAYEMLGEGLTNARVRLQEIKNSNNRFGISIDNQILSKILNESFIVYQSIIDGWKPDKDYYWVSLFLKFRDYKIIAESENIERSQIWKRQRSLNIQSYIAIKNVLELSTTLTL